MARMLTADDVEAGLVGGLFLSAGGSGRNAVDKNRGLGRMALDYGGVRLVALDELDPDATVITATAVGAPGFANWAIKPRDAINAARRLIERLDRPPVGVICGHVPGFNAWLVAAALGLDYVDAASNGRGHPTVKMGGMGLASRLDLSITQIASSGSKAEKSEFAIVAEGDIVRTSNVMRQAAVINGGLIYAARGPLTAGFIKENGAAGRDHASSSISAAPCSRPAAPIASARRSNFSAASCSSTARSPQNNVTYGGGFDLGQMIVRGSNGEAVLGVYNEFMTADFDGKRVATFPDMIGTLDPADRRGGVDLGIEARQPRRRHHRASVEISGRQGRARPGRVPRGREGHGRRHAVVSLRKGVTPSCCVSTTAGYPAMPGRCVSCLTQLGIPFERVTLDLAKGATAIRRSAPRAALPACPCSSSRTAAPSWSWPRSCSIWRRARLCCRTIATFAPKSRAG